MQTDLEAYVRKMARERGLSLAEVARRAGLSRQALYDAWQPDRYPSLTTVQRIAEALSIHPLSLLQPLFGSDIRTQAKRVDPDGRIDRGFWLRDDNYPDGSHVAAGSHFRKRWTVQNAGEQTWDSRLFTCQDQHIQVFSAQDGSELLLAPPLIPDQQSVAVPTTAPGEKAILEVNFTAPSTAATVVSYWKLTFADGKLCFPETPGLWVKVAVTAPSSPLP